MYWVDLPGYGFAKVSQSQRSSWSKMIWNYIEQRENLETLFLLIDSRHTPQQKILNSSINLVKRAFHFLSFLPKRIKKRKRK